MTNPFLPLFQDLKVPAEQKTKMADELLVAALYTFIAEQAQQVPDAEKVTLLSFLKENRADRALLFLEKSLSPQKFSSMLEKTVIPLIERYAKAVFEETTKK